MAIGTPRIPPPDCENMNPIKDNLKQRGFSRYIKWAVFLGVAVFFAHCSDSDTDDSCTAEIHSKARKGLGEEITYTSCFNHKPISRNNRNYVIHDKGVYFVERSSSDYGKCIGNFGSYSSAGRSFCPFGSRLYTISRERLFPLENPPVDVNKFRVLEDSYGTDGQQLFYRQFIVENAEALSAASTLNLLPITDPLFQSHLSYAVYGGQVLFEGRLIVGADAETFRPLFFHSSSYAFAADKHGVYYENAFIDGADAKSFTALKDHTAQDNSHKWKFDYEGRVGMIVQTLPLHISGNFFKSKFKTVGGSEYTRIQWHETLFDGTHVLWPLALSSEEIENFEALPIGCGKAEKFLKSHPKFACEKFKQSARSNFGKVGEKVYFEDRLLFEVDGRNFQIFDFWRWDNGGAIGGYLAMNSKYLYKIESDSTVRRLELGNEVIGPIPNRFDYLLFADEHGFQNMWKWGRTFLCLYKEQPSGSALKRVAAVSADGRSPFMVFEDDLYRYVFFDLNKETKENYSHIVERSSGRRLEMFEYGIDRQEKPCGPIDKS